MKPYIWPSDEVPCSKRRTFARDCQHHGGTLNLFSSEVISINASAAPPSTAISSTPRKTGWHSYHNKESTKTEEFPAFGIRRVQLPKHQEQPQGIRQVRGAAGAQQNVQVVNIKDAYKDPLQMGPLHTGMRCAKQKGSSTEVSAALRFAGASQKCSTDMSPTPVGRPRVTRLHNIDYSATERFIQVVRDHVQKRRTGVSGFYVYLVRNSIGESTPSTPRPMVVPWSLHQEPEQRVLTLRRCRDQLVSLTSLPVSLQEVAGMLWGPDTAISSDVDEVALGDLPVSFKDFAAAFGENSFDGRLNVMKV